MTETIVNLLDEASRQLTSKYELLFEDAKSDSGSAGDNGEEIWAQILRDWLPSFFDIKTKAKIIDKNGIESPQIDIVVLSPYYPDALKKGTIYYLASGVVCAFECKNTLKSHHIGKFFKTSKFIAEKLIPPFPRPVNIEHVLRPPVLYGLLAHSHDWKKQNSSPRENINSRIKKEFDNEFINSPRELPSLICVADVASWTSRAYLDTQTRTTIKSTMHYWYVVANPDKPKESRYDPLNVFLVDLYSKIALYYPPMRIADTIIGDLRYQTSDRNHQNVYLKAAEKLFPLAIVPDRLLSDLETYRQ